MTLDFAFVCDYADSVGKLSALGIGFDTIFAGNIPCVHPNFHLVMQLRASVAEVGRKDVEVRLIDADGKDVVPPLSGPMEVPQPPPGALDTQSRLVVGFAGTQFPAYGQYALHVIVQGNEMVRIPIRVAQPPITG
jgi:hypothetical protein